MPKMQPNPGYVKIYIAFTVEISSPIILDTSSAFKKQPIVTQQEKIGPIWSPCSQQSIKWSRSLKGKITQQMICSRKKRGSRKRAKKKIGNKSHWLHVEIDGTKKCFFFYSFSNIMYVRTFPNRRNTRVQCCVYRT
jgi:hypothetical protein